MDHQDLVKDAVEAIASLDAFPVTGFMDRLFNATRNAPHLADVKPELDPEPSFGPAIDGTSLNGRDEAKLLNRLGVQSVVNGISTINKTSDRANFTACVNKQNAKDDTFGDMTRVTTLLYVEYVNWALEKHEQPRLEKLHETSGFAGAFEEYISRPRFISSLVATELAHGVRAFSTSLLLVCEYLHQGPGFTPFMDSAFDRSSSNAVLGKWITGLLEAPELQNEKGIRKIFDWAACVASIVVAPVDDTGRLQSSTGVHMRNLVMRETFRPAANVAAMNVALKKDLVSEDKRVPVSKESANPVVINVPLVVLGAGNMTFEDLVSRSENDFVSIVTQCKRNWATKEQKWHLAAANLATVSTQSSRRYTSGQQDRILSLNPAPREREWLEVSTHTGRPLANWISKVKSSHPRLFTNNSPKVTEVTTTQVPVASCFRPGTKVATDSGDIAIEAIVEGTRLRTDAKSGMGTCSDEVVMTQVSEPLLVGFNGTGVFASLGHVFHTTTGLRAVDPTIALGENPWMDVGRLQRGHILHKLSDDHTSCSLVPITSIEIERVPSVRTVHGVHFRSGERSYFANGFLVAVNYPEITIKSVAAALKKLPKKQQVQALYHIKELRPLFWKLGVNGVHEMLRNELKVARKGQMKTKRHPRGPRFQEMRRSFVLSADTSKLVQAKIPEGYRLPKIDIFEGTLSLDGEHATRAAFDSAKGLVRWSREIEKFGFEHGVMTFHTHGFGARGAVLVSDDEDPQDLKEGHDYIVPFTCSGPHGRPRTPPQPSIERKIPTDDRVPGLFEPGGPLDPNPNPNPNPGPGPDSGTDGADETTTDVPIDPSKQIDMSQLGDGFITPIWDESDYFETFVDEVAWPEEIEVRSSCIQPKRWGTLGIGLHQTNLKHGLILPEIIIPGLDRLLEVYNASVEPYQRFDSFYDSQIIGNEDNTTQGKVQITAAATISALSDQFVPAAEGQQLVYPTENLTFVNALNTEIAIPLLFAEAEMDFDVHYDELRGAVWKFDPTMTGALGERFFFEATYDPSGFSMSTVSGKSADLRGTVGWKRSKVSRQAATPEDPDVKTTPAVISDGALIRAATPQEAALNRLLEKNLSETTIQDSSQAMFQKLMLYYMDPEDREKFTSDAKPDPLDITPNLEASLNSDQIEWIRAVYGKAYVTYSFSRLSKAIENGDGTPEGHGLRHKLTEAEKKKIWYFWTGSGETCLSQSKEYNEINELISLHVTREYLGQDFQTEYLANNQGPVWAKRLVGRVTTSKYLGTALIDPINKDRNLLNNWCTLSFCLDPRLDSPTQAKQEDDGGQDKVVDYTTEIYTKCMAHFMKVAEASPSLVPAEILGYKFEDWVADAIGATMALTYQGGDKMDTEFRSQFDADFSVLMDHYGIAETETQEERQAQLVHQMSLLMAQSAGALNDLLVATTGRGDLVHRIANLWSRSATGMSPRTMVALRGVFTSSLFVVFSVITVRMMKEAWPTMTTLDKTACATEFTHGFFQMLTGFSGIWRDYRAATIGNAATTDALDSAIKKDLGFLDDDGLTESVGYRTRMNNYHTLQTADSPAASGLTDVEITNANEQHMQMEEGKKGRIVKTTTRNKIWGEKWKARLEAVDSGLDTNEPRYAPMRASTITFRILSILAFGASLAALISTSISLFRQMKEGNLTDKGKAVARAQITFTVLATVVEGMALLFTASLLLPVVGFLIALVGIALSIIFMGDEIQKPEEPPLTDMELFIRDQAKPLLGSMVSPPPSRLTYTMEPVTWAEGAVRTLRVTGKNTSSEAVSVSQVALTLLGGTDDRCLFTERQFTNREVATDPESVDPLVGGDHIIKRFPVGNDTPMEAALISTPYSIHTGIDSIVSPLAVTEVVGEEQVTTNLDEEGNMVLIMQPGHSFMWIITGTVTEKGKNPVTEKDMPGESTLDVVELLPNGDKTLTRFEIQRIG